MNSLFYLEGRGFTDEDREKCLGTIDRISGLANLARREGVLALEEAMLPEESFFLRLGISLIVDGREPEQVERVLQNLIISENPLGSELLNRFLMLQGILLLQRGENPRMIVVQLAAMLGEKYCERLSSQAFSRLAETAFGGDNEKRA